MRDPERLLDHGATELEARLLGAGDAEEPSTAARQAAMAALGISGAALASTGTATAASAAVGFGARAAVLKWVGLGVVAAVAVGGTAYWQLSSAERAAAPSVPPRSTPAPVLTASVPNSLAPVPSLSAETSASPPVEMAPAKAAAFPAASGPKSIQDQVALIDQARRAAAAGRAGETLALVDAYARRFPGGALTQDATMLRIEALAARGDHAKAEAEARRFLARYPHSALAPRVKALLGSQP